MENKEVKKSRFASHEFLLVMLVLVILVAIIFPLIVKYVGEAEREALGAHGEAVWIMVTSAVLLEDIKTEDIDAFADKYKNYRKLTDIAKGSLVLEKAAMEYVKTLDENDLYVKMKFENRMLHSVTLSKNKDGSDPVSYTN